MENCPKVEFLLRQSAVGLMSSMVPSSDAQSAKSSQPPATTIPPHQSPKRKPLATRPKNLRLRPVETKKRRRRSRDVRHSIGGRQFCCRGQSVSCGAFYDRLWTFSTGRGVESGVEWRPMAGQAGMACCVINNAPDDPRWGARPRTAEVCARTFYEGRFASAFPVFNQFTRRFGCASCAATAEEAPDLPRV